MEKNEIRELLEDYTYWLVKYRYTDTDTWAEEPTAVERYLEQYKIKQGKKTVSCCPICKNVCPNCDLGGGACTCCDCPE